MSFLLKDPDSLLDYSIDWGIDYLDDDAIETSDWTVEPAEPGGVAITASRHDLKVAAVDVGGGIAGRIYRLTNQVTLVSGREDRRSVMLRVERR